MSISSFLMGGAVSWLTLTLTLTLWIILILTQTQVSQVSAAFTPEKKGTNITGVPKPTNITCYVCKDSLVKEKVKAFAQPCSKFRDAWRKFKRAKKEHTLKSDYRNELLSRMKKDFGHACEYGTEDCYMSKPTDPRISGFEERGCGSGPKSIDAEPQEGCVKELQKKGSDGEKIEIMNCVCEEKADNYKGYCNKAAVQGTTFRNLLAFLALLHLLLAQFN